MRCATPFLSAMLFQAIIIAPVVAAPVVADDVPDADATRSSTAATDANVLRAESNTAAQPAPALSRRSARKSVALPLPGPIQGPQRTYRIACRIVERQDDGQDKVTSSPKVVTVAHQPAQIQIAQATPLVTGVETNAAGASKPNVTVVTTGLSLAFKIAPDRPGRASFDVSIERSDIESVDVTRHADGSASQSARVASQTTRVIDVIEFTKKFVVGIDHKDPAKSKRRAEFVVDEIEAK